jgi:cytochrome c2
MKRITVALALGFLLTLIFTVPSFAGGWAVITLDELPGQVIAGQPLEIGFMVRQHGVTPMEGLEATVLARNDFGKSLAFTAKEEGQRGHYTATIDLPEAGEWEWSIQAFTVNQPIPPLTVIPAAAVENPADALVSAPAQWPQWLAGFLGAVVVLAGLVISSRRKARWAVALILAGVVLSAGSIVSAAGQAPAKAEAQAAMADSNLSQVEMGYRLFIAKGCMACHSHAETNRIREFGVDIGPDLTNFTASPDYLKLWLKDPSSVKPATQMPTLGLSDTEIEALIAFINTK